MRALLSSWLAPRPPTVKAHGPDLITAAHIVVFHALRNPHTCQANQFSLASRLYRAAGDHDQAEEARRMAVEARRAILAPSPKERHA